MRDICLTILKEHFGNNAEAVGSALISAGRSTCANIAKMARLPASDVRLTLLIMMQQNIVTYAGGEEQRTPTFYEINTNEILCRIRFPLYINWATLHLGPICGSIIKRIILFGSAKPNLILADEEIASREKLEDALCTLIDHRLIRLMHEDERRTKTDTSIAIENNRIASQNRPLSQGDKAKLRKELAAEMEMDLKSKDKYVRDTVKRKAVDEDEGPTKRLKEYDGAVANFRALYRVDYERFHIFLRNEKICELVSRRVNAASGAIVKAFLGAQSPFMIRCSDYEDGLAPISKLSLGFMLKDLQLPIVENNTGSALEIYLKVMAEYDLQIMTTMDDMNFQVNLKGLTSQLRIQMIESIIKHKFGPIACRLWRMLYKHGKLDEKQITKLALIHNKTARTLLYSMFREGFVFIQDVPKTLDHSATRTFFLWFVSYEKTADLLMRNAYETIRHLKLRLLKEESCLAGLIQKSSRTDIRAGEATLSDSEQQKLNELNRVRGQIYNATVDLSNFVMVINEF